MELTERQQEYIDGLHALADFLTAHPDFIENYGINTYLDVNDPEKFRSMIKNAKGRWEKNSSDHEFNVLRYFGPHSLNLYIPRDKICERIVTGTKIIQVPDPDRPMIDKEVETYEWKCNPILAPES